ncbi:hypothetical protein SAMN02745355_0009 [Picrophilus oshimae DSM 9789]|nr:hypothetical protein SAMN02745355_0009 [Picrophilus oshimae DSM 9789]
MVFDDAYLSGLSPEDERIIIDIARCAILNKFRLPCSEPQINSKLKVRKGVFVTVNNGSELRGCIGYPMPVLPLHIAIKNAAIQAAFADPRFEPLRSSEINKINLEVTILGDMKEISYYDINTIIIGRHGIYIESGIYSGILLPQVAVEYNMTPIEFLRQTCIKAGIEPECYRRPDTRIYIYEGKIIRE